MMGFGFGSKHGCCRYLSIVWCEIVGLGGRLLAGICLGGVGVWKGRRGRNCSSRCGSNSGVFLQWGISVIISVFSQSQGFGSISHFHSSLPPLLKLLSPSSPSQPNLPSSHLLQQFRPSVDRKISINLSSYDLGTRVQTYRPKIRPQIIQTPGLRLALGLRRELLGEHVATPDRPGGNGCHYASES